MENPATWSALTAALDRCDFSHPEAVWATVAAAGLIEDRPAARAAFLEGFHAWLDDRPPPEDQARDIAETMSRKGLLLEGGDDPQLLAALLAGASETPHTLWETLLITRKVWGEDGDDRTFAAIVNQVRSQRIVGLSGCARLARALAGLGVVTERGARRAG